MCGDSTSLADVSLLMNGQKAVLLHADPPYGMGKQADGVANDNLYEDHLDKFQLLWWAAFRHHLVDNASAYIWGNSPDLWRLWYRAGLGQLERFEFRNHITWDKKSIAGMKSPDLKHNLGFVPIVWVKNLPGGDDIDGQCTFPTEAIDTQIEIDYQLSQAGRGLKYSSDPTLLIKEPAVDNDGKMVKGGGNAIVVGPDGDAKMLEINGTAATAVLEYVRGLREMALESAHGNRTSADKISAAQSGRAMELMNQSLIWLSDKLRISYGEGALLDLLRMVVKASTKFKLVKKDGTPIGEMNPKEPISLRWPQWYQPTYADKMTEATTLGELRDKALISQETAVKTIASSYDVADPTWLALIDDASVLPGDYLVGNNGGLNANTYFIAGKQFLLPVLAIECNRSLHITRQAAVSGVGDVGYAGSTTAQEVDVLGTASALWPASILFGGKSQIGVGLPAGVKNVGWRILLPPSATPTILAGDTATDDLGRRYVIEGAESTDLGWRLSAQEVHS